MLDQDQQTELIEYMQHMENDYLGRPLQMPEIEAIVYAAEQVAETGGEFDPWEVLASHHYYAEEAEQGDEYDPSTDPGFVAEAYMLQHEVASLERRLGRTLLDEEINGIAAGATLAREADRQFSAYDALRSMYGGGEDWKDPYDRNSDEGRVNLGVAVMRQERARQEAQEAEEPPYVPEHEPGMDEERRQERMVEALQAESDEQ